MAADDHPVLLGSLVHAAKGGAGSCRLVHPSSPSSAIGAAASRRLLRNAANYAAYIADDGDRQRGTGTARAADAARGASRQAADSVARRRRSPRASVSTSRSSTTRTAPSGSSSRSAGAAISSFARCPASPIRWAGCSWSTRSLLTATGYSLTLLMATLFRRLIAMRADADRRCCRWSRWCLRRAPSRSSRRGAMRPS